LAAVLKKCVQTGGSRQKQLDPPARLT